MPTYSNIPAKNKTETENYFDDYFVKQTTVSGNFYDSAIAFFERQTNNKESAAGMVAALLETIRSQNLDPNVIMDKFKKMSAAEINQYMVAVLNYNRKNTSFLGYKAPKRPNILVDRTLLP